MTESPAGPVINLQNVTKIYRRRVHALRGINMQVHPGEIFGLLGPNGAGKSTLVKIMMTVVRPTHAEGNIFGHPIGHKPTLRRIGYLPENHRFPKYLTGRNVIEFFAALAKVPRNIRKKRADELIETVGMHGWGDTKIGQYSKGMLQRIGLAQAMAADPDLIVLDEPTDGVDPAGRRDIRQALFRLRDQGKTVFINSHLLTELENLCDRVAILVRGTVARQGTLDELTRKDRCYVFELMHAPEHGTLSAAIEKSLGIPMQMLPGDPSATLSFRGKLSDGTECQLTGPILHVARDDAEKVQDLLDAFRRNGIIVKRMQLLRPSLEELFFEAIGNAEAA